MTTTERSCHHSHGVDITLLAWMHQIAFIALDRSFKSRLVTIMSVYQL